MRGLVAISLVVALAAGVAGEVVARRWWPEWGGPIIAVAASVNLGACWVAFVPVQAALRRRRERLPQAILTAMMVRLGLVGVATMAVVGLGLWGIEPVALWFVVFYCCLLTVETAWVVQLLKGGCEHGGGSATR